MEQLDEVMAILEDAVDFLGWLPWTTIYKRWIPYPGTLLYIMRQTEQLPNELHVWIEKHYVLTTILIPQNM